MFVILKTFKRDFGSTWTSSHTWCEKRRRDRGKNPRTEQRTLLFPFGVRRILSSELTSSVIEENRRNLRRDLAIVEKTRSWKESTYRATNLALPIRCTPDSQFRTHEQRHWGKPEESAARQRDAPFLCRAELLPPVVSIEGSSFRQVWQRWLAWSFSKPPWWRVELQRCSSEKQWKTWLDRKNSSRYHIRNWNRHWWTFKVKLVTKVC